MATQSEINAVADILSDSANSGRTAEQVAEEILDLVTSFRRRDWKYVTIAQDRAKERVDPTRGYFVPTWVRGPFLTLPEARKAATKDRGPWQNLSGFKVMTAQVFGPDDEVDPAILKEVLG